MSALVQNDAYAIGQLTPSIVLYEPSFEGWLSAVLYVHANRLQEDASLKLPLKTVMCPP